MGSLVIVAGYEDRVTEGSARTGLGVLLDPLGDLEAHVVDADVLVELAPVLLRDLSGFHHQDSEIRPQAGIGPAEMLGDILDFVVGALIDQHRRTLLLDRQNHAVFAADP